MLRTLLVSLAIAAGAHAQPADLLTAAERSDYTETMRYDEVVALLEGVESRTDIARLISMGRTSEGRPIPLMVLADPPVATPTEAHASGKLVLFAFGNIHAGEVCGKEALSMLARDIALNSDAPEHRALLDRAVLLIAPIYNADGNERMAPGNRPGQNGPNEMGQRPNAQGLDLNRDHIKLESPEARAMAGLITAWNPHLVIDTHTTNGSWHRLTLTYETPLNPSAHPAPINFLRDGLLPRVRGRVLASTGYDTFYYGNFNRERTAWYTYDARPRFNSSYIGLRGRAAILTEAYSYAPYKDRVLCTLAFVRESLLDAVANERDLRAAIDAAERDTIAAGRTMADRDDLVGLRHEFDAFPDPVTIPGWVEAPTESGRPRATDEPLDREVTHYGRFRATRSVVRPLGYLIPVSERAVLDKLRQHGVRIDRAPDRPLEVETATIVDIERAERIFQGHNLVLLETERSRGALRPGADWRFVSTAQPLGNLIVYMLEAESEDGLAAWNFLDDSLAIDAPYPIRRVVGGLD
ncbi:MAG: M14 family metallopeptidase [Phycisphaerales bacterium]